MEKLKHSNSGLILHFPNWPSTKSMVLEESEKREFLCITSCTKGAEGIVGLPVFSNLLLVLLILWIGFPYDTYHTWASNKAMRRERKMWEKESFMWLYPGVASQHRICQTYKTYQRKKNMPFVFRYRHFFVVVICIYFQHHKNRVSAHWEGLSN